MFSSINPHFYIHRHFLSRLLLCPYKNLELLNLFLRIQIQNENCLCRTLCNILHRLLQCYLIPNYLLAILNMDHFYDMHYIRQRPKLCCRHNQNFLQHVFCIPNHLNRRMHINHLTQIYIEHH